jgi:Protein of unknown function (DUF2012)
MAFCWCVRLLALAFALAACSLAAALDIQGRLQLPDSSPLETTVLTLNGGQHTAYSQADGKFVFHSVGPGVYVLDVLGTKYHFSQAKLKVPESGSDVQVRQDRCSLALVLVAYMSCAAS